MKKQNRGRGFVFQPGYRDKKTGAKRMSATWWISYSLHGKRFKENAHTTDQKVAVKLLNLRVGQAVMGRPVAPQTEKTSLDDLIAMVEAHYKANGLKSGKRIPIAARHLREYFSGDCKAREITSDRITAYVAHRQEQKAKNASINIEQAFLRRGFTLAARAGKVSTTPMMSMLHLDNARTGFFEREQFEAMMRHLPDHLKPVAQVAYYTGWRREEVLSRQWRHVDLERGVLRLEPGETKNGKGREFPLYAMPELRAVIEAQRTRVTEIERATGQVIPWVFVSPAGKRLVDFRNRWKTACRRAGCPARLMHDFRRTAVRNLERAGVPRSTAMKLTGHLTDSVYQRYAIVDSTMLEEGVAKLAAMSEISQAKKFPEPKDGPSTVKVRAFPVKRARKNP
jgi:integrase